MGLPLRGRILRWLQRGGDDDLLGARWTHCCRLRGDGGVYALPRWYLAVRLVLTPLFSARVSAKVLPLRAYQSRSFVGRLRRGRGHRRKILDREEQLGRELGRERVFPHSARHRRMCHRKHGGRGLPYSLLRNWFNAHPIRVRTRLSNATLDCQKWT